MAENYGVVFGEISNLVPKKDEWENAFAIYLKDWDSILCEMPS